MAEHQSIAGAVVKYVGVGTIDDQSCTVGIQGRGSIGRDHQGMIVDLHYGRIDSGSVALYRKVALDGGVAADHQAGQRTSRRDIGLCCRGHRSRCVYVDVVSSGQACRGHCSRSKAGRVNVAGKSGTDDVVGSDIAYSRDITNIDYVVVGEL